MWQSMTEAQGTVIAAALTIFAAVVGVLLGSWLFGGKVASLKESVDATERLIEDHRQAVSSCLQDITDQLGELSAQLAATQEGLGQLRSTAADIESAAVGALPRAERDQGSWEALREEWNVIKDELEKLAASPEIDGRTRAKYSRIDRRNYVELINALEWDQRLGNSAGDFRSAVEVWQRFKNGRSSPNPQDLNRFTDIRQRIQNVA